MHTLPEILKIYAYNYVLLVIHLSDNTWFINITQNNFSFILYIGGGEEGEKNTFLEEYAINCKQWLILKSGKRDPEKEGMSIWTFYSTFEAQIVKWVWII